MASGRSCGPPWAEPAQAATRSATQSGPRLDGMVCPAGKTNKLELNRVRGGVEHHHDTPPYPVTPSPTSGHSSTGGDTSLSRAYARELLALQPDVLFAVTNTSIAALHAEHSDIPTVFAMVSDPVGMHYVESFSRPGGNVTGFTPFEPTLGGKWASLLKETAQTSSTSG